jgi:hypothetical protein
MNLNPQFRFLIFFSSHGAKLGNTPRGVLTTRSAMVRRVGCEAVLEKSQFYFLLPVLHRGSAQWESSRGYGRSKISKLH